MPAVSAIFVLYPIAYYNYINNYSGKNADFNCNFKIAFILKAINAIVAALSQFHCNYVEINSNLWNSERNYVSSTNGEWRTLYLNSTRNSANSPGKIVD